MSKVWFCRNCGYEVPGRGRCHLCKRRLEESPLPELTPGDEDDEVGYRLQEWDDPTRGALIVGLIEANILHRFEDDELVVAAEDEARTDDLVERITTEAALRAEEEAAPEPLDELTVQLRLLADAARRLRADPTDMQADADAMEASSVVFMADEWSVTDPDTWAAIGRVTRRLLVALGSEEALEDDIRMQSGILDMLLTPLLAPPAEVDGSEPEPEEPGPEEVDVDEAPDEAALVVRVDVDEDDEAEEDGPEGTAERDGSRRAGRARLGLRRRGRRGRPGVAGADDGADGEEETPEPVGPLDWVAGAERAGGTEPETGAGTAGPGRADSAAASGDSVYELPDWMPEQRAQLSLLLEEAGITYGWDAGDLVVPTARDTEVEELFSRVEGVAADEDEEASYRALENLFAAADRFLNDPDSETKAAEIVRAASAAEGPTPVGVDEALWWSIRQRARTVAASIEGDAGLDVIFGEARDLRDELRPLM